MNRNSVVFALLALCALLIILLTSVGLLSSRITALEHELKGWREVAGQFQYEGHPIEIPEELFAEVAKLQLQATIRQRSIRQMKSPQDFPIIPNDGPPK